MCRYLAGDALDSDDSDDNDEDDDDDQPDKFEDSCDNEKEESHQSKLDEMLAKFRTQKEQPRQVTTKIGNTNQKPLEQTLVHSQPQREDRQAFPCLQAGCNKICKSLGGLALHVKRVHGAKNM